MWHIFVGIILNVAIERPYNKKEQTPDTRFTILSADVLLYVKLLGKSCLKLTRSVTF